MALNDPNKVGEAYNTKDGVAAWSKVNNAFIEIEHLLTGTKVLFTAFVKEFNDDHQSTWTDESVYGRMDDMTTFANTKRMITINFDVPSYNIDDGLNNLGKISLLKQFLYPAYNKTGNALAISSAPLVRLKFINFVYNNVNSDKGLLGRIKNIAFAPNEEAGYHAVGNSFLGAQASTEASNNNPGFAIPKMFSINIGQFAVLHEHQLGWVNGKFTGRDIGQTYPFAVNTKSTAEQITSAETNTLRFLNDANKNTPSADQVKRAQTQILGTPDASKIF